MMDLWNVCVCMYVCKHLPTRRSEKLVDHSAQLVRRNARRIVRSYTAGRAELRAVTLRQIAEVLTRPYVASGLRDELTTRSGESYLVCVI